MGLFRGSKPTQLPCPMDYSETWTKCGHMLTTGYVSGYVGPRRHYRVARKTRR